MQALLFRFLVIGGLFLVGTLLGAFTGESYTAIPIVFIAVTLWTLILGFRKALFITIPLLIVADVLWDAKIGALFLGGFLLATATTYLAVRIETRSRTLRVAVYSVLVAFFATLVLGMELTLPYQSFDPYLLLLLGKIFAIQFLVTLIFFLPLSYTISRMEVALDRSYQEQSKKIR